jgi:transcriptional regulator with XRE-family HTH domain
MQPGNIIKAEREKRQWSQQDLGDRIGVSQVAIMKIEAGTTKKSKHIPKIAQVLQIPLSRLDATLSPEFDEQAVRPHISETGKDHTTAVLRTPADQLLGGRDLPVFSTAQDTRGVPVLSDEPIRFVARPHNLHGIKEAFGVLIVGNKMAREYREGDIAYVDPHLPPRAGDACLFERPMMDGREVIVAYLDKAPDSSKTHWHASQSNPEKRFTLEKSEWSRCYVLVGKQSGR